MWHRAAIFCFAASPGIPDLTAPPLDKRQAAPVELLSRPSLAAQREFAEHSNERQRALCSALRFSESVPAATMQKLCPDCDCKSTGGDTSFDFYAGSKGVTIPQAYPLYYYVYPSVCSGKPCSKTVPATSTQNGDASNGDPIYITTDREQVGTGEPIYVTTQREKVGTGQPLPVEEEDKKPATRRVIYIDPPVPTDDETGDSPIYIVDPEYDGKTKYVVTTEPATKKRSAPAGDKPKTRAAPPPPADEGTAGKTAAKNPTGTPGAATHPPADKTGATHPPDGAGEAGEVGGDGEVGAGQKPGTGYVPPEEEVEAAEEAAREAAAEEAAEEEQGKPRQVIIIDPTSGKATRAAAPQDEEEDGGVTPWKTVEEIDPWLWYDL